MRFEFSTATRIVFGAGAIGETGKIAAEMGSHAFVVTGSSSERARPLFDVLSASQLKLTTFHVVGEPTIEITKKGVEHARTAGCDIVIGFGGGSVIDGAKAIAALLTNGGEPLDYLEVIGKGQPLEKPPVPYIAIPTTAGAGAEVTRNAVLKSEAHQVKVSLRHALMLPRVALVDPELTYSVPPDITASTGMDALTQVLEPFVSHKNNPLTDSLCRDGMQRVARSLRRAFQQGDDREARQDMSLAALFGGLALANAKLGAVHGFAGPFGGMFDAPHGAVCACLLPHATAVNIQALKERDSENPALKRYDEAARILTGKDDATADDLVPWLQELAEALQIPSLGSYGCTEKDFPALIEKAAKSSSMKGNPIELAEAELKNILQEAI